MRAVQVFGAARLESPSSPPVCITPADTFAPAAPKNLVAVGSEGGVSLIWEANTEADLDGYIVLRGAVGAGGAAPAKLAPHHHRAGARHDLSRHDGEAQRPLRLRHRRRGQDHAAKHESGVEPRRGIGALER